MKRAAGNLLAAGLGVAAALLLAEAGTRLLWRDAPAVSGRGTPLPLERVADPRVLYRLVPGSSGEYNGTSVRVNGLGLRGREIAIPAPAGTTRILVLGDSMVFGVGLSEEETLPAYLERALPGSEAINAGVFGYNQAQEIALLERIVPVTRPDIVLSCFVHNDIDNWGLGEGGAVPEIRSSRFDPPPPDAWSARLAEVMLPGGFDPDRLNLLPASAGRGARHAIAAWSRLYLLAYLRLRTTAWNLTSGERRDPLVDSRTCQAEEIVWRRLREGYRRMDRTAREAGARLIVVIQGGLLWEGLPLDRLHRLLAEERIPFLDLTPVWFEPDLYAREYSLGWDPHPNGRANEVAGRLIADYLRRAGLTGEASAAAPRAFGSPDPHAPIAADPALRDRLQRWKARQSERVGQDLAAWSGSVSGLPPSIDLAEARVGEGGPRILHGFWDPGAGLPTGGTQGWWMSDRAAVLLGPREGAREVVLDLAGLLALGGRAPERLTISLGEPPDACGRSRQDLTADLTAGAELGALRLRVPLPEALRGADPLELEIQVDRAVRAAYLDPRGPGEAADPRLVSFIVRRIALE